MTCPSCGSETAPGAKFCAECGTRLASQCPSCGTQTAPTAKFCAECGTALTAASPAQVPAQIPGPAPAATASAERRLVSVLFADLVGFTTLSESRDAEEVRELLTRYFDTCTTIITRYGGTVEKFIGDAVMAVWGAPVANEDDAERAVRAALDLVAAIELLGAEAAAAGLSARAGVLTGEAAVTVGAAGQGMVAGDLVNTASRIQSAAPPGGVLVGEATRYATQAAVVYEDAGLHELKGKAEPVALHRALRVAAMRSGENRSTGLEAPFVGRAHELRAVRDLMHLTADRSSAQLLSITGIAGIGKSRLSWELEKYVDGLVEQFWWHRGRCLAYGEGVTFSALADMVRMRARIADGEDAASAGRKLSDVVTQHVPDESERRWVEPRLRHLLGLDTSASTSQEDLFAAWRLFIERMSGTSPVVLVFEDMHWADSGLLDFIEYLIEWSRDHPVFVVTLARPEILDRRPSWGTSRRNVSSLYLEPLPDPAMRELMAGLVPGLPDPVTDAVLARAGGVPLYAVETVRMMLDKGLLAEQDGRFRATGQLDDLDVPDTLHALVAARLDGLAPTERRLLGAAAVLGKAFTEAGLQAVSGEDPAVVRDAVETLLRREILERSTDPRSPERGQLQFVQDLVQLVAYETLSRRDRRDKHLAVAAYLDGLRDVDGDIVEVIASHYVDALALMPDDEAAAGLRATARTMLLRAGERVAGLGSWDHAWALYEKALPLATDAGDVAEVHERAGQAAFFAADLVSARRHYDQAIADLTAAGLRVDAARIDARLAEIDVAERQHATAIERMRQAHAVLAGDPSARREVAALAGQIARTLYLSGRPAEEVTPLIEQALAGAEAFRDTETLSHALNTRSLVLSTEGRPVEARALLDLSLDVAMSGDHHHAALRAYNNLVMMQGDLADFAGQDATFRAGFELAHLVGNRFWEKVLFYGRAMPLIVAGQWDEALQILDALADDADAPSDSRLEGADAVAVLIARGDTEAAARIMTELGELWQSDDAQVRLNYLANSAAVLRAQGDIPAAKATAREAYETAIRHPIFTTQATVELLESLHAAGDLEGIAEVLETLDAQPPGHRQPYLDAHRQRFEGLLAAARGEPAAGLEAAALEFRAMGTPFPLAVTLLEHAEWLVGQGHGAEAEPLLVEAQEIFTRLKATPWLERLAQAQPQLAPAAAQ